MRRRAFLGSSAGAIALAALRPLSQRARAADVVEYRLVSTPVTFSPAPGIAVSGLAYNGSIPGPLLRAVRGQRVRIRYASSVKVPTSIHWHGMILPNAMDGVAGVTQEAVATGGEFVYEFALEPAGTRWYHDHAFDLAMPRGLFGMFVVEDPSETPADKEFALVFHDVPDWASLEAALRGTSPAPITEPPMPAALREADAPSMGEMKMGDEVAYVAHCVNGACYPNARKLAVKVGDRVRLRLLNASPTQTRYLRLAGHALEVTHADGNAMAHPLVVDVLRIGSGERYDVFFEVKNPGAFLLAAISTDPLSAQQAVLVYTEGMESAPVQSVPASLEGARIFSYVAAGGVAANPPALEPRGPSYHFALGGGGWGSNRWSIDGKTWPDTPKLYAAPGDLVTVRFVNTSDMDHPMHLHGHIFDLLEVGGTHLGKPLRKDVSLVPGGGGTTTWRFRADASPGRWLLHCHNDVHMVDGMMTELVYHS